MLTALGGDSDRLAHAEADLADPSAPERLVGYAIERLGTLDALVVNHARCQLGTLAELDANTLDLTWAVNVRAALLLVRAFADQYRSHPDGGRIVLFTSGQHRGRYRRRFPTPPPRAPSTRSPRLWPTHWPTATSRSTASTPDPPTPAGPPQSRTFSSPTTCPAAGGTPQPRRPTSSRCCSHQMPRPSPAKSSTPRADSGASHPDQRPADLDGRAQQVAKPAL